MRQVIGSVFHRRPWPLVPRGDKSSQHATASSIGTIYQRGNIEFLGCAPPHSLAVTRYHPECGVSGCFPVILLPVQLPTEGIKSGFSFPRKWVGHEWTFFAGSRFSASVASPSSNYAELGATQRNFADYFDFAESSDFTGDDTTCTC